MEAKGWAIVETGSAAGLDGSIAKAAEILMKTGLVIIGHQHQWLVNMI